MKKKSHLLKLLKMDLHRCIGAKRFPVIIALIVVLLIANVWESVMIIMFYILRYIRKNVISSTTVNAAFYSYMVSSLTVMLLGNLVYAFNVVTGKNWPGILAASCLVLADPVVIYFYHEQTSWMMLFSPVNWSSIENLKKYSGEGMLTSVYVYAVSLSICAILMIVIKEKTQEMDL